MDTAPVELKDIPSDFPRRFPGSVPGVQAKLPARFIDGSYVAGETEAELRVRFDACDDLVAKLSDYSRQKQAKLPGLALPELLRRLRRSVAAKGWDISPEELQWVMGRVALALGARLDDVIAPTYRLDPRMLGDGANPPVESIVDRALAKSRAR